MATGVVRLRRRRANNDPHEEIHLDSIKEEEIIEENPISNGLEKEPLDEEEIQKNLEQVRLHALKLQRAHDYFSRRQQRLMEEKGPVRQRLGVVRVRRMGPPPVSAPSVAAQRQIIRRRPRGSGVSVVGGSSNNGPSRRRFALKRLTDGKYQINTAQNRMERVRAQLANNTCPVRLRRNHPSSRIGLPRNSNNLTIQVPNFKPSTNGQTYAYNVDRFRLILDPEIQTLIRQLQDEASDASAQIFPIGRVTPQVTSIFLSTRFSELT